MFVQEPQTPEQLEAIALVSYINELSRQLNSRDVEKCSEDELIPRSPSPPPEYDRHGKRTNTREHRIREAVNVELTLAVRKALELIPNYCPPSNFNRLARIVEKYMIPVRDFPEINFVGLLLGPRGNALRRMEADSGARISIRGRGSVKEGSRLATTQQGQEEDLHCLVSATSYESIKKAFGYIKQVIDTATQTPEHQNDFKRLQLRELAELNGTLRDYENQLCTYCGEPGHRRVACPQREAALRDAVCRACGQKGHMLRDCESSEAQTVRADQSSGLHAFFNDLEDDSQIEALHSARAAQSASDGELERDSAPHDDALRPVESEPIQHPASGPSFPARGNTPQITSTPASPAPPGVSSLAPLPPGVTSNSPLPPGFGGGPPPFAPGVTKPSAAPEGPQLMGVPGNKSAPPPPSAWKPPTWKPPVTSS